MPRRLGIKPITQSPTSAPERILGLHVQSVSTRPSMHGAYPPSFARTYRQIRLIASRRRRGLGATPVRHDGRPPRPRIPVHEQRFAQFRLPNARGLNGKSSLPHHAEDSTSRGRSRGWLVPGELKASRPARPWEIHRFQADPGKSCRCVAPWPPNRACCCPASRVGNAGGHEARHVFRSPNCHLGQDGRPRAPTANQTFGVPWARPQHSGSRRSCARRAEIAPRTGTGRPDRRRFCQDATERGRPGPTLRYEGRGHDDKSRMPRSAPSSGRGRCHQDRYRRRWLGCGGWRGSEC
jgi:hypothetical protein